MKALEQISEKTCAPAIPRPPGCSPVRCPISPSSLPPPAARRSLHAARPPLPIHPLSASEADSASKAHPSGRTPQRLTHPDARRRYDGYFVDLYVRVSNTVAINMYKKFGYSIYRQVIAYRPHSTTILPPPSLSTSWPHPALTVLPSTPPSRARCRGWCTSELTAGRYRQVIDYYSGANPEDAYGACSVTTHDAACTPAI